MEEAKKTEPAVKWTLAVLMKRVRGISLTEKLMFTRNLSVMIGAGLSLTKALDILGGQAQSQKFSDILNMISLDVSRGEGLASSFAKFPDVFNDLFVNMIRVGEIGGTLENALKILGDQMKKEHDLRSKVRGAMIYPSVVIIAMSLVGVLMMIFVVPTLAATFSDLNVELPVSTRFVIGTSLFLQQFWYLALLAVAGIVFGLRAFLKTKRGKDSLDFILMRTPIIQELTIKINSAAFARTLSSLIDSGVAIVKSLEITANTLGNHYFADALRMGVQTVQKGKTLRETLAAFPDIYPQMIVQMIAVGEETGRLSAVLKQLALFYEEEVDNTTKNLSSVIEPFIMILIGGVIGFFAVSMISPMYSLSNAF